MFVVTHCMTHNRQTHCIFRCLIMGVATVSVTLHIYIEKCILLWIVYNHRKYTAYVCCYSFRDILKNALLRFGYTNFHKKKHVLSYTVYNHWIFRCSSLFVITVLVSMHVFHIEKETHFNLELCVFESR